MASDSLAAPDVATIKRRTLRISLVAIASVFVFEFTAGIFTNSLALLTDSTHALLDVVVTLVLIIATTLATRPRDIDHTYGHGKIETVGGFIGGTALFVVAVFFIYEAVARLAIPGSPGLVRPAMIGFVAIAFTLAVDVFRIIILRRAGRMTGAATIKADLYHSIADFASTVVALAGLWLVSAGFAQGDSLAAIVLGGFLGYLSVRFVYHNATELTDEISPKLVASVRKSVSETEGVFECKDIKMRRVGRDVFVDITISLRAHLSFGSAHQTSDRVEENVAKVVKDAGLRASAGDINVHFEPIYLDSSPETIVEMAAGAVQGVRGVHNILVSKINGVDSIGVSLHIQVNRGSTLSEAHALADAVEDSIRNHLSGVEGITVHLEPHLPEIAGMQPASSEVKDAVRNMVLERPDVERVGKISAYSTEHDNILKIDIGCVFKKGSEGEMTIEQIHDRVSEIEKRIRARFPGSIVTIHAEPG
ncbi:MAG TPA: cation diffusion facilitator family transporter [Nitrososphaera sp.]|nr:cation diffusion facilitator family transporter [Nitrososphaera sp.]